MSRLCAKDDADLYVNMASVLSVPDAKFKQIAEEFNQRDLSLSKTCAQKCLCRDLLRVYLFKIFII